MASGIKAKIYKTTGYETRTGWIWNLPNSKLECLNSYRCLPSVYVHWIISPLGYTPNTQNQFLLKILRPTWNTWSTVMLCCLWTQCTQHRNAKKSMQHRNPTMNILLTSSYVLNHNKVTTCITYLGSIHEKMKMFKWPVGPSRNQIF